jgi:hypothetical protein
MVFLVSFSTLQQLQAGQLRSDYRKSQQLEPVSRLQISADLTEFPRQVLELADSLEILDLSNNKLSQLPDDLDRLQKMRILFLSNNQFDAIPEVLASCPKLEMISFKSSGLKQVGENVLPIDTRWLILTDNAISKLPDSMGKLHRLQKLALAGNQLTELPESMSACKNLELARLSANNLTAMPDWLFQLPKLSWLAFSGNDFNGSSNVYKDKVSGTVPEVSLNDIEIGDLIGEGASGFIYRARWQEKDIAIKIFKGLVTSDGYPEDELDCCLTAGSHSSLIPVIAQLDQKDEAKTSGIVMKLIPASYRNLGLPPSLQTCTRDTFVPGSLFSTETILAVANQLLQGLMHLHRQGISHGDIYAHNTLLNQDNRVLLGDFGAATNLTRLSLFQAEMMEKIEVRALGCLIEDLVGLIDPREVAGQEVCELKKIVESCLQGDVVLRPNLSEIKDQLLASTMNNGYVLTD